MKGWVDVPLSESEFGKFIRILEARDKDYRKALGSIPGLQEDATIRWEGGYGSTFESPVKGVNRQLLTKVDTR